MFRRLFKELYGLKKGQLIEGGQAQLGVDASLRVKVLFNMEPQTERQNAFTLSATHTHTFAEGNQ